jgi:hypothetical protein
LVVYVPLRRSRVLRPLLVVVLRARELLGKSGAAPVRRSSGAHWFAAPGWAGRLVP